MPRLRDLVDSRLLPELASSFFSRRVSIEAFGPGARSATGFRAGTPATLTGHDEIPAAIEPIDNRGNQEKRQQDLTVDESTHEILLAGYFPDITPRMRAVADDGEIYDITKVDVDTLHTLTRLSVRQVNPVAQEGA